MAGSAQFGTANKGVQQCHKKPENPWEKPRAGKITINGKRVELNEAIQAGAHILTVPPKFFPQMCAHPKTDEAVAQFMTEFRAWEQAVQANQLKRAA